MDDLHDIHIPILCPVLFDSCIKYRLACNGFSADTEHDVMALLLGALLYIHYFTHLSRLSVSHDDRHALAVPLDNSHIKLYDLAGNRLAHLPRRGGQVGFRNARIYWCKQLM